MTTENLWTILHFVSLFTTKSNFNQDCGVEIAGSVACFRKESKGSHFFIHAGVRVVFLDVLKLENFK